MIELGTTGNNSANYCLVYNYYSGSNPSSCALPSQGASNNGNVMGYRYQDSVTSSQSHTAAYAYDTLNRLSTAQAKDFNQNCLWGVSMPTSNGYDRWGNLLNRTVTCGTATTLSRSINPPGSNHISGFSYDAAGNVTADGVHTYQWDAEGRASSIDGAAQTYNALGERVYSVYPGAPISLVFDPAGQLMGAIWGWGWNYFLYFQGRMLVDYEADGAHFGHASALGSVSQYTDWTGTTAQPILFYPWGQVWQNPTGQLGNALHQEFASLPGYDPSLDQYVTQFRRYSPTAGIWLSPDPLAGDISNPQSLNRYAYVLNNPTSLTDPLGLNPYEDPGGIECRDPTFAESHAQCQGPGSPWCTAFPDDLGCIDFGAGGGGGGGGGQAGGGGTPPTSGRPVGGGLPPSMGNAAFGGLITCTRVSVKIGGVSYPAGPLQCTPAPWLQASIATVAIGWSINIPIPVRTPAGIVPGPGGPAITGAFHVQGANNGCAGGGWWAGTPGAKTVSAGPLLFGNPSNSLGVLSGQSWSLTIQGPVSGFQVIWNSSGVLAGPTVGLLPGISLSSTWSACN
jgi:RHS repeat-associated protein